eukprot:COSAG03_NODE_15590_length_426_cov_1.012232_1_plen_128_part_10
MPPSTYAEFVTRVRRTGLASAEKVPDAELRRIFDGMDTNRTGKVRIQVVDDYIAELRRGAAAPQEELGAAALADELLLQVDAQQAEIDAQQAEIHTLTSQLHDAQAKLAEAAPGTAEEQSDSLVATLE